MSWDVSLEQPNMIEMPHLDQNITYNVGPMLRRAGLHPKVLNGMTVEQALPITREAVVLMADHPEYFSQFDAKNGWGSYGSTFDAVTAIHRALLQADIRLIVRWQ
jgi:hypothetical protein